MMKNKLFALTALVIFALALSSAPTAAAPALSPSPLVLYDYGTLNRSGDITLTDYNPSSLKVTKWTVADSGNILTVLSSNDSKITVQSSGDKKGDATVSCVVHSSDIVSPDISEDIELECAVTVLPVVRSIEITTFPLSSDITAGGSSYELEVTVTPDDAISQDIEWTLSSSDTSYVSVESNGTTTALFTAHKFVVPNPTPGENPVTVTAASIWSHVSPDTCQVVVNPFAIDWVKLSSSDYISVSCDFNLKLDATIQPDYATEVDSYYESENPLVVGVSDEKNGMIYGIRPGEANVTFTFEGWRIDTSTYYHYRQDRTSTAKITVISPPPRVKVKGCEILVPTGDTLELKLGMTYQAIAEILPFNATDKTVYWTASDANGDPTSVASVSDNGVITALSAGKARIKVETADRGEDNLGFEDYFDVVVTATKGAESASVVKTSDVKNKIEQLNEDLAQYALAVNFGFGLEMPGAVSFDGYGPLPAIVTSLSKANAISIATAESPASSITGLSWYQSPTAKFTLDVSSYHDNHWTAVLPVEMKMELKEAVLTQYLQSDVSAEEILKSPSEYADALFETFSIQKEAALSDDSHILINLIPGTISADKAIDSGALFIETTGDALKLTLRYYVADSNNRKPSNLSGTLCVGDGWFNGKIEDPVWIAITKEQSSGGGNTPGGGGSSGGGGGGCGAISYAPLAAMLALVLFFRKRH